jgi:hypothetical protein
MIIATNILSEFGIMSNFKAWIPIAQQSIIKLLSSEKVESNKINAVAFQLAEEILKHLKILDEVISNDLLASTVRDVIERQEMDPDTIISRVGLAIYHSKTLSGQAIFPIIEDEGALYIRFIESEFYKIHKDKFENIMDLPLEARSKTLKVLVAFLVSAYAYYRETSVNNI